MSKMSFRLSQALASGRKQRSTPITRERILAALLKKRATAAQHGLADLEAKLREQIRWALPVQSPETDDPLETGEADASPAPCPERRPDR